MKYRVTSLIDRKRVYEACVNNRDWKQVVRPSGINIPTAYEWLMKYQKEPKKKGGSKPKKTTQIINRLITCIENRLLSSKW